MTDRLEGNKLIVEFNSLGYRILSDGRVLGKSGKFLSLHKGKSGYMQVNTWTNSKQKTFSLHRLLASAFIPNPDNLAEINHIDGNKLNNELSNLEWCSRSQNIKHGIDTGIIKKSMVGRTGKKHWASIPVLMYDISGNSWTFESTGDAARQMKFSAKSIQDACSGRLKTYKGFKWKYIR